MEKEDTGMPVFDFDDFGVDGTNVTGSSAAGSVAGTDAGVNFTLSVSGPSSSSFAGGMGAIPGQFSFSFSNSSSQSFTLRLTFSTTSAATAFTPSANATISASGISVLQSVSGNAIIFTIQPSFGGVLNIFGVDANFLCFAEGTLIETETGPRAVETLAPGDRLRTADGGLTSVRWLGLMPVDTRLCHPAKVNPIRITAGALGEGLPERDLMLSADHAICLDGILVNAGALVNGTTITQVRDMPLDGFTYYHVETDAHQLLLAEGVAAESFIDYAGRDSFVNGGERAVAATIPEMDLPRISDARLVPEAMQERLLARAEPKSVLEPA